MLAAIIDRTLSYPRSGQFYSPDCAYPEYRHQHLSNQPNSVYRAVRQLLADGGLDRERFDTEDWNPLGALIRPGSRVFVLCNFVYHKRESETDEQMQAKCTHGSVVRALLDYVLIAAGPTGRIRVGNAPLQSCVWDSVLSETGVDELLEFYGNQGFDIEACDLRSVKTQRSRLGGNISQTTDDLARLSSPVDLNEESMLSERERRDDNGCQYRVSDYDPRETESCHRYGRHRYHISKEILDAEVVLSVPTLKTHEKVGVTCCIKGLVGTVASKSCLAHHRFGGSADGGDEYPGGSRLRRWESQYHDWLNRLEPNSSAWRWHSTIDRILGLVFGV